MNFKTVTFNIRCVYGGDGINGFMHRAGLIWDTIKAEVPDVIGFQEVTEPILELLRVILPDYEIAGSGRGKCYNGEGLYIAAKKSSCEIVSCASYWLSDTINVSGSGFEGQCCNRIFNAAVIRHKALNKIFRVYNVHHDCTEDEKVRHKEAEILLSKVAQDNTDNALPTIIMGDFNTKPHETPIALYNSFEVMPLCDITKDIPHTFHGYGHKDYESGWKIDYIFVSDFFSKNVVKVEPWTRCSNGIYLSDHYPICAEFEI